MTQTSTSTVVDINEKFCFLSSMMN